MKITLPFLLLLLLFSCIKKDFSSDTVAPEQQTMDNMQVNPNFKFNTDAEVVLQITTLDNADNPVPGKLISARASAQSRYAVYAQSRMFFLLCLSM